MEQAGEQHSGWICAVMEPGFAASDPLAQTLWDLQSRDVQQLLFGVFSLMYHEWKVYLLLQVQQTKISRDPTHHCKLFSKLMKKPLFLVACGHFSLENSILLKVRREVIRNSYRPASGHVWEQSKLAVMGQAVPKPCAHCLEKEPG